ncbi:MAG: DUF368 domain-containing protein [Gemmatimonadota bacterium]|nr:DUF368 domain-containing protein [Gemmatimonadota bacterium]
MIPRTRSPLLHYLQGLLMGSADVVPGVSGGTVALIVGIYEPLVGSVRAAASIPVAVLRGDLARARELSGEVHWRLVLPLAAGILTALIVGARFIPGLLDRYPVQMRALFFGLIAGSVAVPWRRITAPRSGLFATAVASAVVAFVLVGFPPREIAAPALPLVFGAATIAICAMILPGLSGAFLLLVMGMYEPTLRALHERDLAYVAVFVAGAAVGLGVFSRLLAHLLEHRHDFTMAALVGLMVGSLRALWPYLDDDRAMLAPPADGSIWSVLGLALLGFALVTLLTRFGGATDQPVHPESSPAASAD